MDQQAIILHSDGASRGNPGPAGVGVVLQFNGKKKNYREFIGYATNNEAEYKALLFGIKKIKQLIGKENVKKKRLVCCLDSELVVKQLNHRYKIQDENMQKLFMEVWNSTIDFLEVKFEHIQRERNREADQLANRALDEATCAQSRMF